MYSVFTPDLLTIEMSKSEGGGKKSRFNNAGKLETTGVANRGQHGGTINKVLRAGIYLPIGSQFFRFFY